MDLSLRVTVRRFDGAWRVFASESGSARRGERLIEGPDVYFELAESEEPFEKVHCEAFDDRNDAYDFAREIREGLQHGRDLNLRFWIDLT